MLVMLAFSAGEAAAQNCTGAQLGQAAIGALVTNRYVCVGASPNAQWNELHTGGKVIDYKLGPSDPVDPSDTVANPTGTYVIGPGSPQSVGKITYTYPGGGTYSYTVRANLGSTNPATGTYSFCGASAGSPNLAVTVSASHC